MVYSTRYPNTVAIANNREAITSLLKQLEGEQTELDNIARAGTDTPAFQEQLEKRNYLLARVRDKVKETSTLLDAQIGKGHVNQGVLAALHKSLSRIEKRTASYRDEADTIRSKVNKVEGELDSTGHRMDSEYLQLALTCAAMVAIILLSARLLTTTTITAPEIAVLVGAGTLVAYYAVQYVHKLWK